MAQHALGTMAIAADIEGASRPGPAGKEELGGCANAATATDMTINANSDRVVTAG